MVSWFVSPICSGIIVFILFGLLRTFVLRSKHSFQRAFYVSDTCQSWQCTPLHCIASDCSAHASQLA